MKVAICCIGKLENDYIREFVESHKNIGFNNIILYDNNDKDGEKFQSVIGDYIKSGYVILENYRGEYRAQKKAYTECYKKYCGKYDWIAFIDIDEIIELKGFSTIQDFLSQPEFDSFNCVKLCWKQYTDNDLIYTSDNYSNSRFTSYLPLNRKYVSTSTKSILRTNLKETFFISPHGPLNDKRVKCCNSIGNPCENAIDISNQTWNRAWVNHYRFRTIHEYVMNKMVRLWPTNYGDGGKTMLNLDFFFQYNKRTKEKEKYAADLIKKYNINENK